MSDPTPQHANPYRIDWQLPELDLPATLFRAVPTQPGKPAPAPRVREPAKEAA